MPARLARSASPSGNPDSPVAVGLAEPALQSRILEESTTWVAPGTGRRQALREPWQSAAYAAPVAVRQLNPPEATLVVAWKAFRHYLANSLRREAWEHRAPGWAASLRPAAPSAAVHPAVVRPSAVVP